MMTEGNMGGCSHEPRTAGAHQHPLKLGRTLAPPAFRGSTALLTP